MKAPSLPFAALCFGLLFGAVAGTGCGPSRPVCSPSTCSGCCDSGGLCVSIASAGACGARGETCKVCSLGQSCSFGACTGGNTGAGTATGGGFATGGGAGGGFATGGGAGGGSATGGGSAGGSAAGGGAAFCNTSNCFNGCCQGTVCRTAPNNTLATSCGFGGQPCADCAALGQVCNGVTLTCNPGAGGGSAGGSAGGSPGGGAANPGDNCGSVIPLVFSGNSAATSGSITGYANDTTVCSGTGPDAVYSVTLAQPAAITASVTAFGFTPRVNVRATCTSASTLGCDSAPVSGTASTTTAQLSAGTYFVWVDSSSSLSTGSYSLQVTASGAGGGSAGGGSAGGGSAGGGGASGGYTITAVTTSCDDLTTGATDLLSSSTSPPVSDDAASNVFPIPSPFALFGTPVTHYGVQSNGMVQFFTSSFGTVSAAYTNAPIPDSLEPNGYVAPYWDDLFPVSGLLASVRSKVFITGGGRFTVEWNNLGRASTGTTTRFQAKFFSSGVFEFHYCTLQATNMTGAGATIGAENLAGTFGTEHTAGISTSSALRFTP